MTGQPEALAVDPDLLAHADGILARGSTSFAAAARLLDPPTRRSASLLYLWCRHCDDVIDGQTLGHDAGSIGRDHLMTLADLEAATRAALAGAPPPHPAYQALAAVAAEHEMPPELPLAHLDGFRMDVAGHRYCTLEELLLYCYGVAGVVGEMMACIMGVRDRDTLDRAADLGLAFQLTNIARDVYADAAIDRIYLPLGWLDEEGIAPDARAFPEHRGAIARLRARLVQEAEPFYGSALVGVGRLPLRYGAGIGAARAIYRAIGREVIRQDPGTTDRVSTTRLQKTGLIARGVSAALAARTMTGRPRDPHLWRLDRTAVTQAGGR
jgi:15-cis-phytoene synthase